VQIQRVLGRDLRDALLRARALHGEQARVLQSEQLPGSGVAIAVQSPSSMPFEGALPRAPLLSDPGGSRTDPSGEDRGLAEVRARLERHGASSQLIDRVAKRVAFIGARGAYAADAAADVLGTIFRAARSPRARVRQVLAFVGSPGVGKTSVLVRLAGALGRSSRRIHLLALVGGGRGSGGELAAAARVLRCTHGRAGDGESLRQAMLASRQSDVVLIDAGPPDERARLALHSMGAELSSLHVYGVTAATEPAALRRASLQATHEIGRVAAQAASIVTKLDETAWTAAALEDCEAADLPCIFFSDGRSAERLHRARVDHFADLCLRGRLG
jgi:flagellar biosynthesis GTPase FlhF